MFREQILIPLALSLAFVQLVMACYWGYEASMGRMHGTVFNLPYAAGQALLAAVLLLVCAGAVLRKQDGWLYASCVAGTAGIAFWLHRLWVTG